ncbi:unnamed protein product [Lupinus luteus]|uniref:SHSP domain-containing protein n=1 Tax=Lupinus luteus TaxID=3873 RepID=A0AAV1X8Y0_LUPLU
METELVRRRIHMIASHFPPSQHISYTLLHPMNCRSSFGSVLRRCDNKVYFARQSSASLGYFMRQASVEEGSSTSFVAPKTHGATCESPNARAPCFARPARKESDFSNPMFQPMAHVHEYGFRTPDPPTFARPSKQIRRGDQLHSEKKTCYSDRAGIEWSPRMDVAESEGKYVITVEVPGVNTSDIRVEVDDQKLSVKGSRSTRSWTVAGPPNASASSYHKREILYGPYEVAWPLPTGVNKESVSAELLDGFLHIIIPKV